LEFRLLGPMDMRIADALFEDDPTDCRDYQEACG